MHSTNLNNDHRLGEHGNSPCIGAGFLGQEKSLIDDSILCCASSICPAPISRQFWKAGNYDDALISKPVCQNGTAYLHIHPKFLHSNATSHKWVFGAVAELLDNAIDEVQNGATFVAVDKISNSKDGSPALLIQDDGGGMDPDAMRCCLSFGFSDKKSKTVIGKYGNGFKTSTMRLGADVVLFSCCSRNSKLTRSVGLLSYTFLMQTQQDRIVVPMVDYQFDSQSCTWDTLQSEQQLKANLSILLQWSPFSSEDELAKQFDGIGPHGTKIIVYNLWHNDEGLMEIDFESDPEDICLSGNGNRAAKVGSRVEAMEQHLANRIHHSLRAYLSIIYLRIPENFCILLRGQAVKYHNIATELKYPEFILYKPHDTEVSVLTTIGFLKEAPKVNIAGFNVYHKNRLILPFWHVSSNSYGRCRGVVGVLEANFIEPTHNKQDFEKTPVFQKLEFRLKQMAQEYWDTHCGLIGYNVRKKLRTIRVPEAIMCDSRQDRGIYQPVVLNVLSNYTAAKSETSALSSLQNSEVNLKKKHQDHVLEPERMTTSGDKGSRNLKTMNVGNHANDHKNQLGQEALRLIEENKELRARFQEYEKIDEELNLKIKRLKEEVIEARREYACLQSKLLEKKPQLVPP